MNRTRRRQREPSPDICTPLKDVRHYGTRANNFPNSSFTEDLINPNDQVGNIPYGLELSFPSSTIQNVKGFTYDDLLDSHKDPIYHSGPQYNNAVNVYMSNPDPYLHGLGFNDKSLDDCDNDSINTVHGSLCESEYSQESSSVFHCEVPESPVCEDTELMANRERSKSDQQHTPDKRPSALKKAKSDVRKPRISYAEGDSLVTLHTYSEQNETNFFPPSTPFKQMQVYHRPGKICRMQLVNFMCHEKFDKKWNLRVNFFTGENGSGKSAIVNAIILNLGGTAKMTERVDKASSFIMEGKQFAKIDITYTNDGTLALAKYGKSFTISRTIKYKKGTETEDNEKRTKYESSYKISTPDKKWRKLKRSELNLIKLTFQIMVENPAMFLTQENSRNFGKEKNPESLYKIYYEGMSLAPSERYYLNATSNIQMSKGLLDAKKQILEDMAIKAKRLTDEFELIKKLENKAGVQKQLELEYHWALVSISEAKENIVLKQLEDNDLECSKLEEEIETIEDEQKSFAAAKERREALKARLVKRLTAKRVEEETFRHKRRSMRAQSGPLECEYSNICKRIKNVASQIRDCEEKIKSAKTKSENEMRRIQDEANAQKEKISTRKEELKNKILEEQKAKEITDQELKVLQSALRELREKDSEAKTALRKKLAELKGIQEKKTSVSAQKYNRFGPKMVNLMNLIQQNSQKFKEVPQGPQAACYTVKEKFKEFTPMIEHILGGTLLQFRVTHQQDYELMNKLIKQAYGGKHPNQQSVYPSLIFHRVRNPEKIVLMKMINKNKEKFDTVLDALDIVDNNPATIAWLVDANQVERKLLFETNEAATSVMKENSRVPAGCVCGFTLQRSRVRHYPSYGIYVEKPKNKAVYVQVTTHLPNDELIKAEIKELENECRAIADVKRVKENECDLLRKKASGHERNCKNWGTEHIKLEAEMLSIMTEMSRLPDLVSFETQREELMEFLSQQEALKLNIETKLEKLTPQLNVADKDYESCKEEIFDLEKEISMLEADEENDTTPNDLVVELKKKNEQVKKRKLNSEKINRELTQVRSELNKHIKHASSIGDRVDYRREPTEIQQEINELLDLLKRNKHKIRDKLKIKEEINSTRKTAEKIHSDINVVKKLIHILEPMLKVQNKEFERAKWNSGQSLQTSYHSLITSRNYNGNLILDHEKRTLDFFQAADDQSYIRAKSLRSNEKIQMTNSEKNIIRRERRDNQKMDSGGERSFGTICFMVSMWKIMEVPFIVQDEFDIFMDNMNRQLVQQILLDHTMNQPEAQFSFFTPLGLDIDLPEDNKAITVWRLYPPIRGTDGENNEQQTQMNIFEESGSSSKNKNNNQTIDDDLIAMPTLEKQIDADSPPPPPPMSSKRRRRH